jgi:hypothetical protein
VKVALLSAPTSRGVAGNWEVWVKGALTVMPLTVWVPIPSRFDTVTAHVQYDPTLTVTGEAQATALKNGAPEPITVALVVMVAWPAA